MIIARVLRIGSASIVAAVFLATSLCSPAGAAMTVGSTGDSGGCSLRAVIEAVEAGTSNGCGTVESPTTTINVPANTITLGPQLVVNQGNMAIVGDASNPTGTVIKGGTNRVMEVKASATVKLVGLEITKGHTPNGGLAPSLYTENVVGNGGGILNDGILVLEHVVVTENETGQGDQGLNGPLEGAGGSGGRGGSGGGIFNEPGAGLTIRYSTISKNLTGNGGRGGDGGQGLNAIGHFPDGGDGGHGGSSGDGGGIYNAGSLTIEGSTIKGNFTGRGGEGGTGAQGTGEVEERSPGDGGDGGDGGNSGIQYEKNTGYNSDYLKGGGGIYNAGSLTMLNSTISGNGTGAGGTGGGSGAGGTGGGSGAGGGPSKYGYFADSGRAGTGGGAGRGGGLFTGAGYGGYSPVSLTNVTIYGNRTGDGGTGGAGGGGAESTLGGGTGGWGGDGGGIWSEGASSGSEVVLTHVTIAGNGLGAGGLTGSSAVPERGGCCGERGVGAGISTGGRYTNGSAVFLKNSIVADNGEELVNGELTGDANCYQRYYPTYTDIVDQGGNVTWNDLTCPGKVADPLLGLLANNGGPTETLMPGEGGSAIGAVPAASCTIDEDQRGLPRPGAGKTKCDAGAVETQSGEPPGEEEGGGQEEGGGEELGGGGGESPPPSSGSGGASSSGTVSTPPPAPAPAPTTTAPKPLHCKKGFKKKLVKGKARCVKKKTHRHRKH
jgi:hypothetical protein